MDLSTDVQVGARFTLSSSEFEIAHVDQECIRAAPARGGAMRTVALADVVSLSKTGELKFVYRPPGVNSEDGYLAALTDEQREKVNRRRRYVLAAFKELKNPCSQRALKQLIEKVAAALKDENPPSKSSVAGWVGKWLRSGRNDKSLAPGPRKAVRMPNALSDEVIELVNQAVRAVYMSSQRNTVAAVHAELVFRVTERNRVKTPPIDCPSVETVRGLVRKVDLFQRDVARHGRQYAQRKHRAAGRAFFAAEPLELTMADGQIMDIIVVDSDGIPVGRPFITVIIDVRTRCVLAAYVSLAPFSGATLLAAMKEAVVARPGKPRGVMARIIVDNGSDYRHDGFVRFCNGLDVVIEPCPPKSPNSKAIVERFFRTLNDDLIHRLPGTTFSNPADRGDYESQKHAMLKLEALRAEVQVWLDHKYHLKVHSALGMTPIDLWNEEVETCQP